MPIDRLMSEIAIDRPSTPGPRPFLETGSGRSWIADHASWPAIGFGIDLRSRDALGELELKIEAFVLLAGEDLNRAPDRGVDVEWNGVSRVRARIIEEALDHPVQTIDLLQDDADELT